MSIWLEMIMYSDPKDIPKKKWNELRRVMIDICGLEKKIIPLYT